MHEYLLELSNLKPASPSLINYIKSLRTNKKIASFTPNSILTELVSKNPEIAPQFVAEFDNDPVENIQILSKMGSEIAPYLPDVKRVMEKAPFESLKLLLKHDAIDVEVVDFAIKNAVFPEKKRSILLSDMPSTSTIALEILAKSSDSYLTAEDKLAELAKFDGWNDVSKALAKYPNKNTRITNELMNTVFLKLSDASDLHTTLSSEENVGYDMCLYIGDKEVNNPDQIVKLLNAAKSANDQTVRMSCTYALRSVKELPGEVMAYLEQSINVDIAPVISKIVGMVKNTSSANNEISQVRYESSVAPDLTSLYAAAVILKSNSEHVGAKLKVEEYLNSGVGLIKFDRDSVYQTIKLNSPSFPSTISTNGNFAAFYAETNPIEALSYAYKNAPDMYESILETALSSSNKVRSINAVRVLIEYNFPINDTMHKAILEKAKSEVTLGYSGIFVKALRNVIPTEDTFRILNEISTDNYAPRKQAARDVLQSYEMGN